MGVMLRNVPFYSQRPNGYWCGPVVAKMLIERLTGSRMTKRALAQRCMTRADRGTPVPNLRTALRDAGIPTRTKVNATLSDVARVMRSTGQPVVLVYREPEDNDEHYALCVGLTRRHIILNDPWHGRRFKMKRREFIRRWKVWNCWKWMLWSP